MKKSLTDLERDFEEALERSPEFPSEVKSAVPKALRERRERHFRRPENRDGRGVKAQIKRRAEKAVRQLTHAVGHAGEHPDANIRTCAKELVRSAQARSFRDTADAASHFVGRVNKVGHRRRERERHAARREWQIEDDTRLVEVNSPDQLQKAGRLLGLCVAHRGIWGREYFDQLKSGDALFLRLDRSDGPVGLLQIDLEEKRFAEAKGPDNEALKFRSRRQALKIRRSFPEISGNEVEAFTRIGVFDEFLKGTPAPAVEVRHGDMEYYVWRFADRADDSVILYQRARIRGRKRWSRFEYKSPTARRTGRLRRKGSRRQPRVVEGCHHSGAMTVEEFTALLLDCPDLYEAARRRAGDGLG